MKSIERFAWLTTERSCAIEMEKEAGEKRYGCHPHRDDGQ